MILVIIQIKNYNEQSTNSDDIVTSNEIDENVETENNVINEFKEKLDVLINGNKEIDELRRRPLFN